MRMPAAAGKTARTILDIFDFRKPQYFLVITIKLKAELATARSDTQRRAILKSKLSSRSHALASSLPPLLEHERKAHFQTLLRKSAV